MDNVGPTSDVDVLDGLHIRESGETDEACRVDNCPHALERRKYRVKVPDIPGEMYHGFDFTEIW